MRVLKAQTPTEKKQSLKQGYSFVLSHSQGLRDLVIHGTNLSASNSLGLQKLSALGDPTDDGRYVLPLHCHGENMMSGEEFAAAILALAEENANVTASLDGYMLTYSSKTTASLFPAERIHGAYGEVFTLMFKICAPQQSGASLSTGLGLIYSSGAQSINFDGSIMGESVYAVGTSNATRQVKGLQLSTTNDMPRIIDIRTFGIFRGTVSADAYSSYWGERVNLYLRAPLINYSPAKDIVYPLRGYAERWVDRIPLTTDGISSVDVGASYPTYQLEIPQQYRSVSTMRLDHFSATTNQSTFLSYTFRSMRSADGNYFLITASSAYKTLESFCALFESLGVHLQIPRQTPLIESFEKITIPTRKGKNFLDIETYATPSTIDFTYY